MPSPTRAATPTGSSGRALRAAARASRRSPIERRPSSRRQLLERLEAAGVDPRPPLAYLAGHGLEHDEDELHGAFRRAELLLATGGDPRREIELSDRAVETVADDLAAPELQAELVARLRELEPDATGLPGVAEALRRLGEDPELAWRVYAWALLAEHVSEEP